MTTTATSLSRTTTSACPAMRYSVVLPRSKSPSTYEFMLMYAVFVGGGKVFGAEEEEFEPSIPR
jgi:hypothetical protein